MNSDMAKVLLENQKAMNEAGGPQDIGTFKRISIPLIRRVYPSLIANSILSVQPMTGPQMPILEAPEIAPVPVLVPPRYRSIDDPWVSSKD